MKRQRTIGRDFCRLRHRTFFLPVQECVANQRDKSLVVLPGQFPVTLDVFRFLFVDVGEIVLRA